ncbi:hypothetical protein [Komagataeibacter xylinus]|uniref:hypothetical protein n=1 Tax=Komagataeibacter xylinus TaxID=28448 RepID=UPI0010326391|nr:hypothetical protein [Komagataeibacter xylinus]
MKMATDNGCSLVVRTDETAVRNGFFTWNNVIEVVNRSLPLSRRSDLSSYRFVIGSRAWVRTNLIDLARWSSWEYVLQGGTLEIDSFGPFQVLWLHLIIDPAGGEIIFGPKHSEAGLILIDITFGNPDRAAPFSLIFRGNETLTASYDSDTRITLVGLLAGCGAERDCAAWAVVRCDGDPYGLSRPENWQQGEEGTDTSPLFLKRYRTQAPENGVVIHLPTRTQQTGRPD